MRKCESEINKEEQQKKTALNSGVDKEILKQAEVFLHQRERAQDRRYTTA